MTATVRDVPGVDELAAVLASLPEDAVLSHRSAAQLWGL